MLCSAIRMDDAVRQQLKRLYQQSRKPVIWCGDLNCAHQEIDIWNPEGNRCSAGFTEEERTSFSQTLRECALVDTFRWLQPSVRAYSYIGHRHVQNYLQNRGWRLDYFCCSATAATRILDSYIRFDIEIYASAYRPNLVKREEVKRLSDHCPVVLLFRIG
jgi:exodeoxyribonuclease-3